MLTPSEMGLTFERLGTVEAPLNDTEAALFNNAPCVDMVVQNEWVYAYLASGTYYVIRILPIEGRTIGMIMVKVDAPKSYFDVLQDTRNRPVQDAYLRSNLSIQEFLTILGFTDTKSIAAVIFNGDNIGTIRKEDYGYYASYGEFYEEFEYFSLEDVETALSIHIYREDQIVKPLLIVYAEA